MDFEKYKKLSLKVVEFLVENNCSSINDITIIYNIIRGYPYCLNKEGNYVYKGEFFKSIYDLPKEALEEILKE